MTITHTNLTPEEVESVIIFYAKNQNFNKFKEWMVWLSEADYDRYESLFEKCYHAFPLDYMYALDPNLCRIA